MKKNTFIKNLSEILKVNSKTLIKLDRFDLIEDYDSLSQLSMIMLYDKMKIDKKTIKKLSDTHILSEIIHILESKKIIKD